MPEFIRKIGRALLWGVIWVFVLSLRFGDRTLFSYANEYLVQNALVRTLDEHASSLWHRTFNHMKISISNLSNGTSKG